MSWTTANLSDAHPELTVVSTERFDHFGKTMSFCGPIRTLQVFEDNSLLKAALETPGRGAVLVVDGGGSTRCALVGDVLAQLAIDNDWAGMVLWAAVRDAAALDAMEVGVKAIAASPRKPHQRGDGIVDQPIWFAGAEFRQGAWLYADADGMVISPTRLHE